LITDVLGESPLWAFACGSQIFTDPNSPKLLPKTHIKEYRKVRQSQWNLQLV